MTRFIRFLAVIAIALSPVWVVQTVNAASSPSPLHFPVWPSMGSSGCQIFTAGGITCGTGGFVLTQINSGYACNQLDVEVSSFSSGPFILTATTQNGTNNQTISIDGSGNYFIQFPFFLTNNLISIQITAPNSGVMVFDLTTSTCPVATATDTPNPSNTATNTPVPVTGTATAIPTFTPLPSGHSTFTPTVTSTPHAATSTATATEVPPPGPNDCGEPSFPVVNCNMSPNSQPVISPTNWGLSGYGSGTGNHPCVCFYWGERADGTPGRPAGSVEGVYISPSNTNWMRFTVYGGDILYADQNVIAPVAGQVYATINIEGATGGNGLRLQVDSLDYVETSTQGSDITVSLGHVGTGNHVFSAAWDVAGGTAGDTAYTADIYMSDVYLVPDAPWTPGPTGTATPASTGTATPTLAPLTATAAAAQTATAIAADYTPTPVPIPGAISTNIPTSTECPGGCAVKALTAIPGMATRTMVDTSPFSALTHLSMARSSCAPFGYVQIPYPVITGTPIMGEPLNFGWTVPVTHTWDNTNPLSNTAIQPCAMSEIPSSLWDFTYWFSVFGIATVFIMWLIGLVGRLSGEETING